MPAGTPAAWWRGRACPTAPPGAAAPCPRAMPWCWIQACRLLLLPRVRLQPSACQSRRQACQWAAWPVGRGAVASGLGPVQMQPCWHTCCQGPRAGTAAQLMCQTCGWPATAHCCGTAAGGCATPPAAAGGRCSGAGRGGYPAAGWQPVQSVYKECTDERHVSVCMPSSACACIWEQKCASICMSLCAASGHLHRPSGMAEGRRLHHLLPVRLLANCSKRYKATLQVAASNRRSQSNDSLQQSTKIGPCKLSDGPNSSLKGISLRCISFSWRHAQKASKSASNLTLNCKTGTFEHPP